jgi:tRNA-(ms[2]io[6]A)-hydroxylase
MKLGIQRKDEYVNALIKYQVSGGSRIDSLVEKLLTFALIEARSAERFRLLSLHISDENLRDFYHQFMVSEAGHYKMFLSLAKHYGGEEKTSLRWQEYLEFEADLMKTLPTRGDRMH